MAKKPNGKIRKEQSEIESNTYQLDLKLPCLVNPPSEKKPLPIPRPTRVVHVTAADLQKWDGTWGSVDKIRGRNKIPTYRPPRKPDPSPLED